MGRKGIASVIMLLILAGLLAIGGGIWYYQSHRSPPPQAVFRAQSPAGAVVAAASSSIPSMPPATSTNNNNGASPGSGGGWTFVVATSDHPSYLQRTVSLRLDSKSTCSVRAWTQSTSLPPFPCLSYGTSSPAILNLNDGDTIVVTGVYRSDGSVLLSSLNIIGSPSESAHTPTHSWAFVQTSSSGPAGYLERTVSLRLDSNSACSVTARVKTTSLPQFPCLKYGTSSPAILNLHNGDSISFAGAYRGDDKVLASSLHITGTLND